jgi:hypothetical protein
MANHTHFRICCLTALLLCGLNVRAAQCDDPLSVFSESLKKELQTLENVLKKRYPKLDIPEALSRRNQELCNDVSTKAITMQRAIEKTRLLRFRMFYCESRESAEPSAPAKELAGKFEWTGERMLLAIRRFCGQISDSASHEDQYSRIRDLQVEFFCITSTQNLDMLPEIAADALQNYPPNKRVLAVGKAQCERLKQDHKYTIDDADYALKAARLTESKKLGDNWFLNVAAFFAWNLGRHVSDNYPYYWGVMWFVGAVLWLVFFPLYLLGERFYWDWTERAAGGVFSAYIGVALVSVIYQFKLDDFSKILGLVSVIVGIIGTTIGAAYAFKKLMGKAESKDAGD